MRSVEVLVVGAGASGMMAGITAARGGCRVLLVEKKDRPGKKLLATGNGRCNYTNEHQEPGCYRSQSPERAWEILQSFDEERTVAWFREIGILPGNRRGYLYPASFQASSLLRSMERELERLGVAIHKEESVQRIERRRNVKGAREEGYVVVTDRGKYLAERVIVSTGGMASPAHGSTGDGYRFLEPFSLEMVPVYPALCSLVTEKSMAGRWAGNRVQGEVSLMADGKLLARDRGEIQLVSRGISGIPVFQVSRYAACALGEKRRVTLCLDSMPDWEEGEVFAELERRVRWNGNQSAGDLLEGMLPDKFSRVLIRGSGLSLSARAEEISGDALERLAGQVKHFSMDILGVSGFEQAQTTAGGISLEEINPYTMEVAKVPGIYLTGELLDVDGICGGYNLQWAWTTGYLAGSGAAGMCGQRGRRERMNGHVT